MMTRFSAGVGPAVAMLVGWLSGSAELSAYGQATRPGCLDLANTRQATDPDFGLSLGGTLPLVSMPWG